MLKEIEIIIHGEVQGVGYRQYVAKVGRKLGIAGSIKNLDNGTVQILCKGEEKKIDEFKKQISVNKLEKAPLIEVEKLISEPLEQGTIKEETFKVLYGDINAEMFEGIAAGMNSMNLFREETKTNFTNMDSKYLVTYQSLLAFAEKIKETNEAFERRMEKTDKNIESLLKIPTKK